MSKGFGIAALVFSITGIFIPVVSLYIIWLALILISLLAFAGERTFSFAAYIICLINILFLSPISILLFSEEAKQGGSSLKIVTIILFIIPLVGLIVRSFSKFK